jgi:hypothetical protein
MRGERAGASYLVGGGRGEVWSREAAVLAGELWGATVLAGENSWCR